MPSIRHKLLAAILFPLIGALSSCGGIPVTAVPPSTILTTKQLREPHYRWLVGRSVTSTRFEPLLTPASEEGVAIMHIQSDDELELLNLQGDTLQETFTTTFATEKRDRWDAILHRQDDTLFLAGPQRTDNQDSVGYHFMAVSLPHGAVVQDRWDHRTRVERKHPLSQAVFGAYQRVPSEDSSLILFFYEDRSHFLDEQTPNPYIVLHSDLYTIHGTKLASKDISIPMPPFGDQRFTDRYWRDVQLANDGTVFVLYYAPLDSMRVQAVNMRDGSTETLGAAFSGVDFKNFQNTFSTPITRYDRARKSLTVAVADGDGEDTHAVDLATFDFPHHNVRSARYQPTNEEFAKLGDLGTFEEYQPLDLQTKGGESVVILGKFKDAEDYWLENKFGTFYRTEYLGNYAPSPELDDLRGRSGRSFILIGLDSSLHTTWAHGIKCEKATTFSAHVVPATDQLRFLYADHSNNVNNGLLEQDVKLKSGDATSPRTILHYDDDTYFDLTLTQWQSDSTLLLFGKGRIVSSGTSERPTVVKVSSPLR